MAIMAWRSSEMAHNLREHGVDTNQGGTPGNRAKRLPQAPSSDFMDHAITEPELQRLEERLGPVAYKLMDEKTGEVDLRKLTGDEALQFMSAMGIPIGGRY